MVIGSHPRKSWDRPVNCLKVQKVQRVRQHTQQFAEFCTEPRLSSLHTRSRSPLNLTQLEIVRDVADRRDAQFFKFLGGTSVQSWQGSNVIVRARKSAALVELACDRIVALTTGRNVRSLRH